MALCALTALVLFAMTGCAQQGTPQGGPPDTAAPTVVSTEPATGALLIARDTSFVIEFSEPIERTTLLPNLLVSPPRAGQPRVLWSDGGRRVRLTWSDSLRADATYRITVGARTADQHNNPFKAPYTAAFSTGEAVDLGRIVGQVKSPGEKLGVIDVFAYRTDRITDTFWLDAPDYLTQTGEKGGFDLPFLKPGKYRLSAFGDANRNHRLDPKERFGLAREVETKDDLTPDSVFIFTGAYDTTTFSLTGCGLAPGGGFTLEFSHPIDTTDWDHAEFRVFDLSSGQPIACTAAAPSLRHPVAILLLSDNLVVDERYRLRVSGVSDQQGRELAGPDSCLITYQVLPDSVGPRVESVHLPAVKEATSSLDPIVWDFSEPVDSAHLHPGIVVADSSGIAINGEITWRGPRTLSFAPQTGWPESTTVVARIDSARLVDRGGNPAPQQPFRWTFTPLTSSAMGTLEGRIEITDSSVGPVACHLQLQAVSGDVKITHPVEAPGPFSLDLPAGRWLLGGFLDLDGDRRWDPGSLNPFVPPEPRVLRDDTLAVRARFTLEDVILHF